MPPNVSAIDAIEMLFGSPLVGLLAAALEVKLLLLNGCTVATILPCWCAGVVLKGVEVTSRDFGGLLSGKG